MTLDDPKVHQKQKLFREGYALDYSWPSKSMQWESTPEPPQKMFLTENMIFRGLRLSLGHVGQQVPESPVSQLQNGISTSSLPPFILDLSAF